MGFLTTRDPNLPTTPAAPGVSEGAYVEPELQLEGSAPGDALWAFMQEHFTPTALAAQGADYFNLYTQRNAYTGEGEFPGYDPLNDAQIAPYLDHANAFIRSRSPGETRQIIGIIERHRANQETMAQAGVGGHALMFGAGLLDPVTLAPFGVAQRFIKGGEILQSALASGAAGGAGMFLTDELLQADPMAPRRDVFTDVAGGTLLAGILGAGFGAFARARGPAGTAALADSLKAEMRAADRGEDLTVLGPDGEFQSVGAAAARRQTLEENTPVFSFGTANLGANETLVGNPLSRMAFSPSVESRRIARELVEMPYRFEGERMGIKAPTSVQQRTQEWFGMMAEAFRDIDAQFLKHRGLPLRVAAGVQDLFGQAARGGKLTFDDFKREIAFALRRNDEHAIAEVAAAAKAIRTKLLDPTKQKGIDVGLLDQEVIDNTLKTAPSYLHRLWNVERIRAGRRKPDGSGFSQIVGRWLATKRDEARAIPAEDIGKWETLAKSAKENRERLEPIVKPELKEKFVPATATEEAKTLPAVKLEPDMIRIAKRATTEAKAAARAARDAGRELKSLERRIGRIASMLQNWRTRADKTRPTEALPADHPLVAEIQNAKTAKQPQRLVSWLVKQGGLRDSGGELKALDAGKQRPGLVSQKGMTLDEAARAAQEAGYLPRQFDENGDLDRSAIDDLLDAVRDDLADRPRYSEDDAADLDAWYRAQDFKADLKRAGGSLDMKPEEILAHFEDAAADFKPATGTAKAKTRERDYYVRQLEARLKSEREAHQRLSERVAETHAKAEGRAKLATDLRGRFSELSREYAASKRLEERYTKRVDDTRAMAETPDEDFEKIADIIADKLEGLDGQGVYHAIEMAGLRGPLKERVFDIPDHLIEDFLDNDVERVLRRYTRTMSADTEMARIFGSTDLRDQAREIIDSYSNMLAKTDDAAEQLKLSRARESDLRDLYAMRDRMRGTYGMPQTSQGWAARAGTLLRNFNLIRIGGGFTTASIADIGSVAMSHGMGRIMSKGLKPLIANLKQVKLNQKELRLANVANDMILDTRAHAWADIADDYGRHSKFERAVGWAADKYGLVNLLSVWTGWWKSFSGGISMLRSMEAIEAMAAGKASAKESARMHWLGIDDAMAYRIDELAKKYGTREDGVIWPNTEAWAREGASGEEAATVLRGALAKDANTTIVTPGQEKPLWMSTPMGKIVGQFRSFTMSSMARTTARGLQQRDSEALQGLILMTMGGMMSYYLKTAPDKLSDDPAVWVKEGVDRSGVTGWLFEVNNLAEKLSGNRLGLSPMLGQRPASRFAARGAIGSVLGPSFGMMDDLTQVLGAASQGNMTEKDWKRLQALTPYGNLFYLRWLVDHVADEGDAGS